MKLRTYIRLLLLTTCLTFTSASIVSAAGLIQEDVAEAAVKASPTSYMEVLLSFDGDLDVEAHRVQSNRNKLSFNENYRRVLESLNRNRAELEDEIAPILDEMVESGSLASYKIYTISKTILVKTRPDKIETLANLPGVRLINLNSNVSLVNPVEENDAPLCTEASSISTALESVNVRSLWDRGINGNGSVVCSFDTGIDGDHPALANKWRGNNGASSSESWFAPHKGDVPEDNIGHGTHVMGIMVGGTDTDTIGVAYAAQWISAAVIDQGADFNTTIGDILAAFEWALNPDGNPATLDDVPDVVCNSWGVPKGIFGACDNTFWNAIDNLEAAGVVTVFAAGNEGPNAETIRNPADRAGSPINAFSVGAIDAYSRAIADFSSRGPSSCNGAIKPEVVAPGVSIYSSHKDGSYKVMSGTSMAAPFIAGLVALIRQYNPNATVEEIKYALIASATDLGLAGEDNSYGHGLVDASRLLDYISAPTRPPIQVYSHLISSGGDKYADPGEMAQLTLTLCDPTAMTDSVNVWLESESDWLSIIPDTIMFHFAGSSSYALSLDPFNFQVSPDAISGQPVELIVNIQHPEGMTLSTVTYQITLGHILPGHIFTAGSGNISFTASDFGQFGFGMGSIYQAGGEGLKFSGSQNILFEGGLLVGRSEQQLSNAIRQTDGTFRSTDFAPDLSITVTSNDEILELGYNDDNATAPIPVEIRQTIHRTGEDFVILEFDITNPMPDRIDPLSAGLFLDFDIDRFNDQIGFDSMLDMMYQYCPGQNIYIGIVGLSNNPFAFKAAVNGTEEKSGFTSLEKYQLVCCQGINIEEAASGDWYFALSNTSLRIEGFEHKKIAMAILAASNLDDLRSMAFAAMAEYDLILEVEEELLALPDKAKLYQNYPNPFNPATTISFALRNSQHVNLAVYNVTGQLVRLLQSGDMETGRHEIIWDGTDDNGHGVASGVYFYKLTTEDHTEAKKMMLVK